MKIKSITDGTTQVVALHHRNGLAPTWQMANRFSGASGRIATMEDIVKARLSTRGDQYPWNAYFTTNSAEYLGRTKGGNLVLIVAHGVGPMSTLDGVLQAYGHEYKDKTDARRGGRITQSQFQKLESGGYGPVTVFDYLDYRKKTSRS